MASIAQKFSETSPAVPEPEPIAPEQSAQAAYPVEALGALLGGAVMATSSLAFVPHSMAAQSILAACALAVQPHFNIKLPTGQERPTTLFLVSVAESGDRKSTSDDEAMSPIREYERELEEIHQREVANAALQQSAWDEAKKAATQRAKTRGRDALEEAYRELGPRPEGPTEPTIIVRTGSTQGLLKRINFTRPSLGLMSDEGGSWLGGFGMTEDNRLMTISTLSDFWDGKTIQTMTSGEGFMALRGRRLAFHLMIQPILAGRLLGNAEAQGQGFLSRLLVSQPESLAGTRLVVVDAPPNIEAINQLQAYKERLSRVIRATLPVEPGTNILQPRCLTMSRQAQLMWWEFYNSIESRLGADGDLQSVKGFVGKLPEMAARIAANLLAFERGMSAEELDAETLARGIAIAQFYLSEALRLFGAQTVEQIYVDARLVSQWIKDKWPENLISVSAISSKGPSFVRNRSDYIRDIIALLVRHNHLSEQLQNGGDIGGKHVRTVWRQQVRRG